MAGLLALTPLTAAVADEHAATVQLTWNALSPQTQKSGEQFSYLASLSCQSLSGASCSDVVIDVPYATTAEQHPATSPIAAWGKAASAAVNGVSVPDLAWTDTGESVRVSLGTLKPGEQANVTFRVVPPARTTADGTAWTAALEVSSSTAPSVTAKAIEMSAEAAFRPAVHKALADLKPGSRVLRGTKVSYRVTLADVTGGAVGSVGLSPDETARLVDELPPELEFVSCTDDCTVSGQEIVWVLDQSRVPATVEVTASVRADARVDAIFRNTASAEFVSLIGEKATATSNSVHAVVSDAPDPHDVFRKEAVGNLGDTTPSALGHISAQRGSSYLLKVIGQPTALEYLVKDPLPCTKEGAIWVSLPHSTDALCDEPAFVVSSVKAHAEGGAVSFPRTATLHYADGSSEEITAARSGDTFAIPAGKVLSRIDARGSLAAGAGTFVYTLTGKPAAFAASDSFRNIAAFTIPGASVGDFVNLSAELDTHAKTGAAIGWQQSPQSSTDLTFRRLADLDPASEGAGYNWSYVGWWPQFFSSTELRTDAGAAAVILPEGFKIADRNTSKVEITPDWGGSGQTKYVLSGEHGNVTGTGGPAFNVVIDRVNLPSPGLHTYDMFIGFRDITFDQCLLMDGKAADSNSLVQDTSGIIGSTEGVETSLCHLQGSLLVLGTDPGIALNKSVRSALSPQWTSAPDSVVGIGDDDAVEFLLAWANPGAVAVEDAVIYDVFSRAAGDRTVAGAPRGSSLPLALAELAAVPEGWVAEYSMADNPCRPEVRAEKHETGCTDDWALEVADPADATAIRITKSTPADIGDTLLVTLRFTAPPAEDAVAFNTAASSVNVAMPARARIPLAPLETPRVGAQRVPADSRPNADPDPEPDRDPDPEGERRPGSSAERWPGAHARQSGGARRDAAGPRAHGC